MEIGFRTPDLGCWLRLSGRRWILQFGLGLLQGEVGFGDWFLFGRGRRVMDFGFRPVWGRRGRGFGLLWLLRFPGCLQLAEGAVCAIVNALLAGFVPGKERQRMRLIR